jgi:hypothetical protein
MYEMATHRITASRLVLAGGFALAALTAPTAALLAVSENPAPAVAACPSGETEDMFTNTCTPDLVPNSPSSSFGTSAGNPSLPVVSVPGGGGAIPCTGGNSGQCIGLSEENQGPLVQPHTSVSSSP